VEIRELRPFVAVAEEGGFSAAARALHLSQSALSQTVQHRRDDHRTLRAGLPLGLPASLLPALLEQLRDAFPLTRVDVSHDSSAAQLAALREGELEVALVREHPADPVFGAVLAVEEDLASSSRPAAPAN
jgi:DNA-binding transcriptional LysR family regulator